MSFTVTILGSGSALPLTNRNPSAQYIVCRDRHFLMDCGEGTQIQMRKFGVKFQKINHIFISHLHGDHFFGLVGLLSTMHLLGRDKFLHIYSPKGLREVVELQYKLGGGKLSFDISWHELEPNTQGIVFEDNKVLVETFPLKHRIATQAYIFREKEKDRTLDKEAFDRAGLSIAHIPFLKRGEDVRNEEGIFFKAEDFTSFNRSYSYAYCSDTVYFPEIATNLKDVDVLYHEATFAEDLRSRATKTHHSTASDAAKIAELSKVKKLILGHLSARYTDGTQHLIEAKPYFENVLCAEDGMKLRIDQE